MCSALSAPAAESLEQTIAFLLHRIETADATFIRNGQTHTSQEAVAHVRAKYEHFKGQIKNAGGFYRLAATKSFLPISLISSVSAMAKRCRPASG
jgi:Family of unknown function (DUF5329)